MGTIIVLFVIAATAAIVFAKGSIARSIVLMVLTVIAAAIAFNFYELLAGLFITRIPKMAPWAMATSFVLVFILALCVLGVASTFLLKQKIDFGTLPEQIGRPICGIILGMLFAGVLLTFLALAPLPAKYPYARFDSASPNPDNVSKPIPNADGMLAGIFSTMSKGSFSGKQSFAVMHPDAITQAYLNRQAGSSVPLVTEKEALSIPKKDGVWNAPEGLMDTEGQAVSPKPAHTLMVARVGFSARAIAQAGRFTLSQLRMICKDRNEGKDLSGAGENVYPIGYIESPNTVAKKNLDDVINLTRKDFGQENTRFIDFVFNVPNGSSPVLIQFKANNVAQLSAPANPDQIPAPVPFKPGEEPPQNPAANDDNSTSTTGRPGNNSNSSSGGASSKVGEMLYGDLDNPLNQ